MNASKRDFIVAALSSMSSALAESSKFTKRRRILSIGVSSVGRTKVGSRQLALSRIGYGFPS